MTAALLVGIIAVGLRLTGGQHPHYFPEVIAGSAFRLAGVEVTWAAVTTLALSVAFTLATEQFLARTRTGLQLRALSQRPMAAELIGIRVRLLALAGERQPAHSLQDHGYQRAGDGRGLHGRRHRRLPVAPAGADAGVSRRV